MTFEESMDRFFGGYSETDRERAEKWPGYADAAQAKDITKAQAFAIEALEGCGHTKAGSKKDRSDKRTDRLFDQF